MMSLEITWRAGLEAVGAATILYVCYKWADAAALWLLPKIPMTHYQRSSSGRRSWALVTGASAGIGRGFAHELAARGFNVVILGHVPDELAEAKAAIEAESPAVEVRVIVLDVVTATASEIGTALDSVSSLQLTVLVNNVGGIAVKAPGVRPFRAYTPAELERTINLNARFMTLATRHLLPTLARHGPSLVLNLSSVARMGMPGVAAYSACKSFVLTLSKATARELRAARCPVDVLAVVPGDVESQQNAAPLTPGTPSSRRYTQAVLDRAPRAVRLGRLEMMPWWLHAVQIAFLEGVPEWLGQTLIQGSFEKAEAASAALAANARKRQ